MMEALEAVEFDLYDEEVEEAVRKLFDLGPVDEASDEAAFEEFLEAEERKLDEEYQAWLKEYDAQLAALYGEE